MVSLRRAILPHNGQDRTVRVQLAGDRADGLTFVQDEADSAFLNSSENRRRARRPGLGEDMRDVVSTFRKMSTKPDQAHLRALRFLRSFT